MALIADFAGWTKKLWQRSVLHRTMLVAPPVVIMLLVGFWTFGARQPVQYYTAKVEKGDISQVVQSTGTINAVTTVQVGSQVSGTIAQLFADYNSRVKKDQIIAQIDQAIFRTRLLQAEADLANSQANVRSLAAQIDTQRADVQASKANVDRARAQMNDAKISLKRTAELFDQGIMAASTRDTAQANFDSMEAGFHLAEAQLEQSKTRLASAQANLEQAKAQVAQRKAAAESARLDLDHTVIRAPIDGTVIARNVDVGQTVAASLQAPTLFIIAQDLTKMQVYAKTDESDVGKIRVGAKTSFRVDSFPRETFQGTVSQVRMNATMVQNVVTYDTIVDFDNPDQKLFPGMTAYVTIPVAWANDVVKIPNGALRFKPDISEDERKKLFEKYKVAYDDPQGRRLAGAGGPGGPGGAGGGGDAGARRPGMQRPDGGDAQGGGPQGGGMRPQGGGRVEWGTVWMLAQNKELRPLRVRLGVTDYTFTEMKSGDLKGNEDLIIGQSSSGSAQAGAPGGPGRPPTGGPPMGGMRRM